MLRFSLHQTSALKFKSLIGRFRISYTQEDRIRELMLPAQSKLWSSIGPFPARDVSKAYATAFEPEKDVKNEPLDLKKSYTKLVLETPASKAGAEKSVAAAAPAKPAGDSNSPKKDGATRDKNGAAAGAAPGDDKPRAKKGAGEVAKKPIGAARAKPRSPTSRATQASKEPRRARATPRGPRKRLAPK